MRIFLSVTLATALALGLAACRPASPPEEARAPGGTAYTLVRGDLPALRAHLGASPAKLRVVNMWATWCVPCRREFPELVRTAAAFDTSDVSLTFASLDFPEMEDSVRAYLTRQGVRGTTYLTELPSNPAATLAFEPLWAGELPATFVYDAQGTRRFAHIGALTESALSDTLRALLR